MDSDLPLVWLANFPAYVTDLVATDITLNAG
jgi:hypothetical protein